MMPVLPSGILATPIRQPPTARFLLSAVVTTVRSGCHGRWAEERRAGVVHQVAVDLVADDDQVVALGGRAELADSGRAGQPSGRVIRHRHQDRADGRARSPAGADGRLQRRSVADAAFTRHRGDEMWHGTDQRGLGRVAHPAWSRHGDVGAQREERAEQQCLATRTGDDRAWIGGQRPP